MTSEFIVKDSLIIRILCFRYSSKVDLVPTRDRRNLCLCPKSCPKLGVFSCPNSCPCPPISGTYYVIITSHIHSLGIHPKYNCRDFLVDQDTLDMAVVYT